MLIGYAITAAVISSFVALVASVVAGRKELAALLRKRVNRYSVLGLMAILAFFIAFSLLFVHPVEQLYFDETIYQGIAMNILAHGNALWCQYGTGYLASCYANQVYHDPVGWSVFIAMAFASFGIGVGTAYGLELLVGALSIVAVFLLSSVLFERKQIAVIAALVFATMPLLYVWSRTQADIDLPFMMLAAFAFFFFAVFAKKRSFKTLAMFAFSLALAAYMRIEAMLLVGVFALLMVLFGDAGVRKEIGRNLGAIRLALADNTKAILLLIAFILLLTPELYYISLEAANPSYGQPSGQAVLSLSNFENNLGTNAYFVFGMLAGMNGKNFYPLVFSYAAMSLAVVGTLLFALDRRYKNRFGILAMLWAWFLAYFVFYTAFYAGAATYGVDSRFMLQLLPPISLLGALAVFELADMASALARGGAKRTSRAGGAAFCIVSAAVVCVAVAYPFLTLAPVITISPQEMPQQTVILRAANFFYANYNAVPRGCLVFSFTPDMWYEVNASSAQIGDMANPTPGEKSYGCAVLDYGYWCVVPPYHGTTCEMLTGKYNLSVLSTASAGNGYNTTLYRVLNYGSPAGFFPFSPCVSEEEGPAGRPPRQRPHPGRLSRS